MSSPAGSSLSTKLSLYARVAFGLIIAFGMVGNCLGKTNAAVVVFLITAIVWSSVRICTEAVEAFHILRADKGSRNDKHDPPPPQT